MIARLADIDRSSEHYRAAEYALWAEQGALPVERWVVTPTHRLRVRTLESGGGEPILFVHGLPNAGSEWAPLAGRLPDFHNIVVDLPGCGLSDPIPAWGRLQELMMEVLSGVLDELGLERVAIVANSFGAACAVWLAIARPRLVGSLVFDGYPVFLPMRPPLFLRVLAAGTLGRLLARQQVVTVDPRHLLRLCGHDASVKAGRFDGTFVDWMCSLMRDTSMGTHGNVMLQRCVTWRGIRREMAISDETLAAIGQPALFLVGEEDPFGAVEDVRHAARVMPHAAVVTFPGAGHLPWLDDPAGHARLVRDFVSASMERGGRTS